MTTVRLLAIAALLLAPAAASAQQVRIQLQNGQVSLDAQNAPVRQILAEWARVGGVTITNAEKMIGPAITLQLINVPERQALDILLRSASGYMLGVRGQASKGASAFDRILILPTSTAPRNPPPAPAPPPRFFPQQADGNTPDDGPPGMPRPFTPSFQPPNARPPVAVRPGVMPPDGDDDKEGAQPPSTAPAANPFGVPTGSGAPGVVTPVPPPQDPNRR